MGVIRQISQVLQQDPELKLNIIGHTDGDGDEEANLILSEERAAAVKNVLVDVYGVASDRLQTEGRGEQEPAEENNSPEGKAKNRRVEFVRS